MARDHQGRIGRISRTEVLEEQVMQILLADSSPEISLGSTEISLGTTELLLPTFPVAKKAPPTDQVSRKAVPAPQGLSINLHVNTRHGK